MENAEGARYPDLLLDRRGTDGRVGRITLNRPGKLNALSSSLIAQLGEALRDWEADDSIRVIVLRGAGRGFSTGYDLAPPPGSAAGPYDLAAKQAAKPAGRQYRKFDEQGRKLGMNLRTATQQGADLQLYFFSMAKVTIAEVHGFCLAGGCELAMMADLVVAAEDAVIGHPAVRGLGFPRNALLWPLVLGMRKAKELILSGDTISGTEAERIEMINHAWPAAELEARTIAYADRFAIMTADYLALLKSGTNRWYENMGLYSSLRSSTDMSIAAQFTGEAYLWQEKAAASLKAGKGLKEAFEWRDARYGDKPAKKR